MAKSDFNDRQWKFIQYYKETGNATESCIRAGYSKKTAGSMGSSLLKNPKVKAELEKSHERLAKKTDITPQRIMEELGYIAFFNIQNLFDSNGNMIPIPDLDEPTARAISSIEYEDLYEGKYMNKEKVGQIVKVRMAEKNRALRNLGEIFAMFTENVNNNMQGTLGITGVHGAVEGLETDDLKEYKRLLETMLKPEKQKKGKKADKDADNENG